MKIAIYCSANADIDPDYFRMTEELGRWAGENGHEIVFGGCNLGLMECVAKAAHDAGGRTIGVVPMIIERGGKTSPSIDVAIPCDNLSDRKDLMLSQCDVAVALPGGIGTLDEIFSQVASATIGYHQKPVILYDMKGFWRPLLSLIDALRRQGMIRPGLERNLLTAGSLEEIKALLRGMV